MKAWYVYVKDEDGSEEWDVVWAETRGRAKMRSPWWPELGITEIGARRVPALDGRRWSEVTAADYIRAGLPILCVRCEELVTVQELEAGQLHVEGLRCWHQQCWEQEPDFVRTLIRMTRAVIEVGTMLQDALGRA